MEKWSMYAPLITVCIAILGLVYGILARFAKLELKVETLWDALIRKQISDVVEKGLGKMKSPLSLKDDILLLYKPIEDKLKEFYKDKFKDKNPTDKELYIIIENKFGSRLLEEICLPNGLPAEVSVIGAVIIAKGKNSFKLEEVKSYA